MEVAVSFEEMYNATNGEIETILGDLAELRGTWWAVWWPEHVQDRRFNGDAHYRQCRTEEEARRTATVWSGEPGSNKTRVWRTDDAGETYAVSCDGYGVVLGDGMGEVMIEPERLDQPDEEWARSVLTLCCRTFTDDPLINEIPVDAEIEAHVRRIIDENSPY